MRVALVLVGVDRGDLDGAARLGGAVLADLEAALVLVEGAANRGDAEVLGGELDVGVGWVDGPGAGRQDRASGDGHW